jgi:hypothetical protein
VKLSAVTLRPGVPSPLVVVVELDSLHFCERLPARTGFVALAWYVTFVASVSIVPLTDSHPALVNPVGVPVEYKQTSIGLAEADVAPTNAITAATATALRPTIFMNFIASPNVMVI